MIVSPALVFNPQKFGYSPRLSQSRFSSYTLEKASQVPDPRASPAIPCTGLLEIGCASAGAAAGEKFLPHAAGKRGKPMKLLADRSGKLYDAYVLFTQHSPQNTILTAQLPLFTKHPISDRKP
jgi:hypothetical protein